MAQMQTQSSLPDLRRESFTNQRRRAGGLQGHNASEFLAAELSPASQFGGRSLRRRSLQLSSLPPLQLSESSGSLHKGARRHFSNPTEPPDPFLAKMLSGFSLDVAGGFDRGRQAAVHVDPIVAEAHGRSSAGDKSWAEAVYYEADGADETTAGYLLPAEFAMLTGRLARNLGEPSGGRTFQFSFDEADSDNDGKTKLQEWLEYSKAIEAAYGRSRCKRAALHFLGERKAENRTKIVMDNCKNGLYMFKGYSKEASLRLVRSCSRPQEPALLSAIDTALKQKADPNCALADMQFNGYTPLIFLAMAQTADGTPVHRRVFSAIDLLIEHKADVHRQNMEMNFGTWVPLRFAAMLQSFAAVQALLRHVDVGDRFTWAAGENVQYIMLQELRTRGVVSSDVADQIRSFARYDNHATVLMQLFSSSIVGGSLSASRATKMIAGKSDDESVLKNGARADPNGAGLDGCTALMNVIVKGDYQCTKALLEGRASPCQANSSGATPLHLAAAYLHYEIVELLLDVGAEASVLDLCGFSAWMLVGEQVKEIGSEEKERLRKILELLRPKMDAAEILDMCENDWRKLVEHSGAPLAHTLFKELRLQESLFFNYKVVRRAAYEARQPQFYLLDRAGSVIKSLLEADPLKGKKKELTKYLLTATIGPKIRSGCTHVLKHWQNEDNRATYSKGLEVVVKKMMNLFAMDGNAFKKAIKDVAEEKPSSACAELRALQPDVVEVPDSWQQGDCPDAEFWRQVQERRVLRYDPPWAQDVRDGATCCLALLRLGRHSELAASGPITGLADYSRLQQVQHASMQELMAMGYIKYSQMCNEKFQEKMREIAHVCAEREELDVKPPKQTVGAKGLKRLMEKTIEAADERGTLQWAGLDEQYKSFSYCFHILDTVRLSFTCCGYKKVPVAEDAEEDDPDEITSFQMNYRPPGDDPEGSWSNVFLPGHQTGYIGPDRCDTPVQQTGDDSFFFIIDLGQTEDVDRLEMVNAFLDTTKYNVNEYEIGISDDPGKMVMRRGVFPEISLTEKQSVKVAGYGRYVKFIMKKYGSHSIGLSRLRIFRQIKDDEADVRRRKDMDAQVTSCMALLKAFKNSTWKKEQIQVLRTKSGFAGAEGAGGYADVKMLVMADCGYFTAFDGHQVPLKIVGEVQLILQGYQAVKDRMHLAYECDRGSFGPICVAPSDEKLN